MAAFEVIALDTATPQLRAPGAGDTYVAPRDMAVSANFSVTGNTTLGDATTDTVQVNGTMGVGGSAGGSTGVYVTSSALGGAQQIGLYSNITGTSSATAEIAGYYSLPKTAASSFTVDNVIGYRAFNATKGAGSTITNLHGVYIADQTQGTNNYGITSLVSSGTNKWNIYASGTAANYLRGNLFIGPDTTSNGLQITYASPEAKIYSAVSTGSRLVFATSTSGGVETERLRLSTTEAVFNEPGNDYDFRVESDTNTHALFVQGSDGNVGIGTSTPATLLHVSGDSGVAAGGSTPIAIRIGATDQDAGAGTWNTSADFTQLQFYSSDGSGAGAVVRYSVGAVMETNNGTATALAFRSSGGTERLRIAASGNVSIGGTANRATTGGSAALNIFNGTAPVGTLTNGISIYSSSGEAYVMDAAGNATLFSPHDAETNEWIFKSKHTPTGKVLKIDVERLLRFINDRFGLDAVQEFIEE
jgi:hypothetical protein